MCRCSSMHLWNVGKRLPDYTKQQPRRQPSSWNKLFRVISIIIAMKDPQNISGLGTSTNIRITYL
jgi:hypothetical protein